jgi:hypothetical protein
VSFGQLFSGLHEAVLISNSATDPIGKLGKDRETLKSEAFATAKRAILDRFDDLLLGYRGSDKECIRIWKRLARHCAELFPFLDDARVPADNNGTERDIRSLAAARVDGGVHRTPWSAAAFARIKSVVAAGMKNGKRFIEYGLSVVRAKLAGERLPLPIASG